MAEKGHQLYTWPLRKPLWERADRTSPTQWRSHASSYRTNAREHSTALPEDSKTTTQLHLRSSSFHDTPAQFCGTQEVQCAQLISNRCQKIALGAIEFIAQLAKSLSQPLPSSVYCKNTGISACSAAKFAMSVFDFTSGLKGGSSLMASMATQSKPVYQSASLIF